MSCTVILKDKDLKPKNIKKGVKIFNVVGTYEGGGGGTVVLQDKTANSSTSSQVITYDSADYDGLRQVTINPYVLDTKTVNSSTSSQTVTSDADGLSSVTVNPYVLDTKSIDASTVEQVVTSDADGLSSVTVNAALLQNRTVDASTVQVDVARTSNDYYGLRHVYINPVTSSIDSNIVAGNIKDGVTILGVTGNYSGSATDPWYVKAKKGEITDVSAYSLDEFAEMTFGNAYLLAGSGITTCPQLDSSVLNQYNLMGTFRNCTHFDSSASFDASVSSVGNYKYYAFKEIFRDSNINNASIFVNDNLSFSEGIFNNAFGWCPNLDNIYIGIPRLENYANYVFNGTFQGAGNWNPSTGNVILDVSTIHASNAVFNNAFSSDCYLNSVTITTSAITTNPGEDFEVWAYGFNGAHIGTLSIPNLTQCYYQAINNAIAYSEIYNLNIHPYLLSLHDEDGAGGDPDNIGNMYSARFFTYGADIHNITLTANATDYIYLPNCSNLSATGVLNVLTHLDLTVSGKGVYFNFMEGGLTVTDDAQGSIQAAYNAATAAGWTIHDLTINAA
ncbi:MAG: hypothetical protein II305_03610 [Clostridia bacterium]|nr:hypothetical protein [Clostridia bacterium]